MKHLVYNPLCFKIFSLFARLRCFVKYIRVGVSWPFMIQCRITQTTLFSTKKDGRDFSFTEIDPPKDLNHRNFPPPPPPKRCHKNLRSLKNLRLFPYHLLNRSYYFPLFQLLTLRYCFAFLSSCLVIYCFQYLFIFTPMWCSQLL